MKGMEKMKGGLTDPVCGMSVTVEGANASVNYEGTDYYFCSQSCIDKFNKDPGKYAEQTKSSHGCCQVRVR